MFDIAPFGLPNCAPGEVRFEEPRDIVRVAVTFSGAAPARIGLSYLRGKWPQVRSEKQPDQENPCIFGWISMDDWFNCAWQGASITARREGRSRVSITFRGLASELPDAGDYDVGFRRTLGVRLDVRDPETIRDVSVFTSSGPTRSRLRVELDAGRRTRGQSLRLEGYNARVRGIRPVAGASVNGDALHLGKAGRRCFEVDVEHMRPDHNYCGDDGHLRFITGNDAFTVSLSSLEQRGPIWFAERGFYITKAGDATAFGEYRAACRAQKSVSAMVRERPEQSYAGAFLGQPRPHAVAYSLGCKQARQRFWVDPNGDVVLTKRNVVRIPGSDTPRYANLGDGRFFFGLEEWPVLGRCPDPAPGLAYNIRLRREGVEVEEKAFAVPLERPIGQGEPAGDETIICLLRFGFTNTGDAPARAELRVRYSQDSGRAVNPYRQDPAAHDDWLVPKSRLEALRVKGRGIYGRWKGRPALRCLVDSSMAMRERGGGVVISKRLGPGETCEAVIKVPFINLTSRRELQALESLDVERCYGQMRRFWLDEAANGARIETPVPQLDELHAAHLTHVQITDAAIPGEPDLINTSVGTSTYGNFSNESCMINQELDQRGRAEDARRRLETWVRYQGTAPLLGNFTDHSGVFYGAGGFEQGHYNQHHGWVLWRLSEHFLFTGDRGWFRGVADSVIQGADWVFRQRRNTMGGLPHSRGWEYGFLPAGSLEDVRDFFYWLSTNALTWRGVDAAARALEASGHPEAARIRREADAYARDLRRGFETMRRHSPLVRLRDGRWVPHYPSRLYCRGRDVGWIREVLEGSIYLLISGLYDPCGREARWILDDYLDNRYMSPPYGYPIVDREREWFDRGGFSIQPNLLAGLVPYLDRDEPELYIWMFFNAWCACYREEIGAMVEHPWPFLGFSNTAHFKTSDQANAVMWLRAMFVYAREDTLHFGRAVPRAWFGAGKPMGARQVVTVFGTVGVGYEPDPSGKRIVAKITMRLRSAPGRILVRFRHPGGRPVRSVRVNGRPSRAFDPTKGDVDITGLKGRVGIEVAY